MLFLEPKYSTCTNFCQNDKAQQNADLSAHSQNPLVALAGKPAQASSRIGDERNGVLYQQRLQGMKSING
jgi:hypothetical protein